MTHLITGSGISVIIQGPMRDESGMLLRKAVSSIRDHLPRGEIILSTWLGEKVDESIVDKVVYTEDPGPDLGALGNSNQTRQALSTVMGLRLAQRPKALKWRVEFFFTNNRFCQPESEFDDSKIRVLSSITPNPLVDPRYFHLSDLVQFGDTKDLLTCWELALREPPAFREPDVRFNFWLEPFGNDPMARRPEQVFGISLAGSKGFDVDLGDSGAVKSNFKNFKNYLDFTQKHVEIVEVKASGISTEQDRLFGHDHTFSTSWQGLGPSRLRYAFSRVRWIATIDGVSLAGFWIVSLVHPRLAGTLRSYFWKLSSKWKNWL